MISLKIPCQIQSAPWPKGPKGPLLGPRDVDVWCASLDYPPVDRQVLRAVLSQDERQRDEKFHFDRDRNRFIAARAFLRIILSRYLRTRPGDLEFVYGPTGKPSLGGAFWHSGLQFNLAHSQDRALLAVTRLGAVGVDLEFVRIVDEAEELVARFFSPREAIVFNRLPAEERASAFFRLWTRKEAWLKAVGEGIAHLLAQVEVSFLADEEARLLRVPKAFGPATDWFLSEISPAPGFCAALSVRAPAPATRCWCWEPSVGEEQI